jgi:hypothetical protein
MRRLDTDDLWAKIAHSRKTTRGISAVFNWYEPGSKAELGDCKQVKESQQWSDHDYDR